MRAAASGVVFLKGSLVDQVENVEVVDIRDSIASPSRPQAWDFDAMGNWQPLSPNGSEQGLRHTPKIRSPEWFPRHLLSTPTKSIRLTQTL